MTRKPSARKVKEPREVYIKGMGGNDQQPGTWFVLYANREKRGRYAAGQFDARQFTREYVEKWVKEKRPDLKLIEP